MLIKTRVTLLTMTHQTPWRRIYSHEWQKPIFPKCNPSVFSPAYSKEAEGFTFRSGSFYVVSWALLALGQSPSSSAAQPLPQSCLGAEHTGSVQHHQDEANFHTWKFASSDDSSWDMSNQLILSLSREDFKAQLSGKGFSAG